MGRKNPDSATNPRQCHVCVSPDAHAEIRMISAIENVTLGRVVEDLLRLRREMKAQATATP